MKPVGSDSSWRHSMLAVTAFGALYVLWRLDQGWMPCDDGMLGQAADRLNAGQLPHRDFDEVYTGGLTWLNAWTFRLLGERLISLRIVLFAVFLAWLPTVQYIATRFLRPWHAALVTALAVVWTLPNYPAPMPSWYNLFFATFGAAALLRYVEDRRARWLFVAGVAAGISILFKIVGIFFLAAGLLAVVFLTRENSEEALADRTAPNVGYAVFVTACLLLFVAGLLAVTRQAFRPPEIVTFVLPGALLAAALIRLHWGRPTSSTHPFRDLFRRVIPLVVGAAIPIIPFLIPFVRGDAVDDLVRGVFVMPQRRFEFAWAPALPLWTMLAAIPVAAVAFWLHRRGKEIPRAGLVITAMVLAGVVWISADVPAVYRAIWYFIRSLPVLAVAGAAWHLARTPSDAGADRARLMIVASVMACCGLIQFPYSAPAYFCYAAPFLFFALLPWIRRAAPGLRQGAAVLAAFLIAFAIFRVNGTPLQAMGLRYEPVWTTVPLPGERSGIQVAPEHARVYAQLLEALRERARGGYTWATPDAPEIYYLSGLKNPTRSFYEFLDDSPDREASVLRALDERNVTAIVINRLPFFSPQISREMFTALSRRYTQGQEFGPFVLLWRQ